MMSADIALTMPGGVTVIVPDDLNVATAYILQEQGDSFEAEIRSARTLMRPFPNASHATPARGAKFHHFVVKPELPDGKP